MTGATSVPSLTADLLDVLDRPIRAADRDRAALHLLDWLGCALAGQAEPVGRALLQGGAPFRQAGTGTAEAAGIMGGLGSLLEMDDVHKAALLHPGPVVGATVAALPGRDPLRALLRGYEAMIRLGRAVGPAHYARFHNTGTCGGIGAAVAAATALELSSETTLHAIGHAMSLASGLWQCRNEPVETKHLHVSEAARRGVQAALWAQAGLPGPRFILDGPQGFFAGMAPDGAPARVIADEPDWLIHQVSFKPWPACRHAHAAIDAALALRDRMDGPPAAIRIDSYRDALVFCDRLTPVTAAQARFSLQHSVAVALRDGAPSPGAFEPAALPGYADLRALTTVAEDPALTAAYPARFGATVTVTTTSGQTLSHLAADAWGDPEHPLDAAALRVKFDRLTAWAGVPDNLRAELAATVLALPATGDAAALTACLHRIPATARR